MANRTISRRIYRLSCDAGEDGIRSVDVAEQMEVSKASVNKALATLKEAGYVEQSRYGKVRLTERAPCTPRTCGAVTGCCACSWSTSWAWTRDGQRRGLPHGARALARHHGALIKYLEGQGIARRVGLHTPATVRGTVSGIRFQ